MSLIGGASLPLSSCLTVTLMLAVCAANPCAELAKPAQLPDDHHADLSIPGQHPIEVAASFYLQDINEVNEESETFQFTGVLKLEWQDPRQQFDPDKIGVNEKLYQGNFQFDELASMWFPQVILANASEPFLRSAVVLRISPDGTCRLLQWISATAESQLELRSSPFDTQHLRAVFEVFGFDANRVQLVAGPKPKREHAIRVPQWLVRDIKYSARTIDSLFPANGEDSSSLIVEIDLQRRWFFLARVVLMPLAIIVVLSWSVFWMDRSSLGDRMSVSFVGILTAVSYQLLLGDYAPRIASVTFMHAFINISFWLTCATVLINLWVSGVDRKGNEQLGDTIDRRCRLVFPLVYLSLCAASALFLVVW